MLSVTFDPNVDMFRDQMNYFNAKTGNIGGYKKSNRFIPKRYMFTQLFITCYAFGVHEVTLDGRNYDIKVRQITQPPIRISLLWRIRSASSRLPWTRSASLKFIEVKLTALTEFPVNTWTCWLIMPQSVREPESSLLKLTILEPFHPRN